MPLAGTIAWTAVGLGSLVLPPVGQVWLLFGATGMIVYLGLWLSRFTGENLTAKGRPKNTFETLFFLTAWQAILVYAVAIPFFQRDYTSLPLSVGVLTGLMWVPLSWILDHWIGIAHGTARTVLVTAAWYAFPDHRFTAVAAFIVVLYL